MSEMPPPSAPTPPHGFDPNMNPKAAAKAAKAYAKATRPWFKKKRWWLVGAIVLIIIIAAVSSGGGGSDSNKTDDSNSNGATSASPSTAAKDSGQKASGKSNAFGSAKLPLQNGDWRLDSIQLKDDGLGDFGGTARITYTGKDSDGGNNLFTITVFQGKHLIATLNGSANTVMPGTTSTVQLISQDKFVGGQYKYDFQNDL